MSDAVLSTKQCSKLYRRYDREFHMNCNPQ